MRRIYWILTLCVLTAMSACSDDDGEGINIDGTYEGILGRSAPNIRYAPVAVKLTFNEGKFQGESDQEEFPATCEGTYKITNNRLEFNNDCTWSTDFGSVVVPSGSFELEVAGDSLALTRKIGEFVERYQLTRFMH